MVGWLGLEPRTNGLKGSRKKASFTLFYSGFMEV